MAVKIVRFGECTLNGDWVYQHDRSLNPHMTNWLREGSRLIEARGENCFLTLSIFSHNESNLKFRKGSLISLQDNTLVYDTDNVVK